MNQKQDTVRIDDMQQSIETDLRNLPHLSPPQGLLSSILWGIMQRRELRRFRQELVIAGSILFSLVVTIALFFSQLREEIEASAWFSYLSLASQDSDIILQHWQEATLTFLDALPVYSLLSVFSIFGALAFITYFILRHRAFIRHTPSARPHSFHHIH